MRKNSILSPINLTIVFVFFIFSLKGLEHPSNLVAKEQDTISKQGEDIENKLLVNDLEVNDIDLADFLHLADFPPSLLFKILLQKALEVGNGKMVKTLILVAFNYQELKELIESKDSFWTLFEDANITINDLLCMNKNGYTVFHYLIPAFWTDDKKIQEYISILDYLVSFFKENGYDIKEVINKKVDFQERLNGKIYKGVTPLILAFCYGAPKIFIDKLKEFGATTEGLEDSEMLRERVVFWWDNFRGLVFA